MSEGDRLVGGVAHGAGGMTPDSTWLRPDEAAALIATASTRPTLATIHVIAHRDHWRRLKIGRHVAYHLDDVTDTATRREQHTRDQD